MPRIRSSLLRQAYHIHPLLPRLLPICRDVQSARNELRWMEEHVKRIDHHSCTITHCVDRRAMGEPLQYILGSEFFGNLEMICRPGVLIPRSETAASVAHLAHRIRSDRLRDLNLLDLCSGTGCIPLLFHDEIYRRFDLDNVNLSLVGVDVSAPAIALANENLKKRFRESKSGKLTSVMQLASLQNCQFVRYDIMKKVGENLERRDAIEPLPADLLRKLADQSTPTIVTSNPPYISSHAFRRTTARSVRLFEPRLALVPRSVEGLLTKYDGDSFYPRLIEIAQHCQAAVILFEVADLEQARRVADLIVRSGIWDYIEIWRDEPSLPNEAHERIKVRDREIPVLGKGHGRSVFAYRGDTELVDHIGSGRE